MFRVLYVCQIADAGEYDLSVYEGLPDGVDDGEWFGTRLDELGLADRVETTVVRVCAGETIPAAGGHDAAVLGGSYHMVGEDLPWQRHILEWLGDWRARGLPMFGICGGHQLVARLYGAPVSPLPGGTWSATRAVERTAAGDGHWLFRGVPPDTGFHFGNSEHVSPPPDAATVLATLDDSPAVATDYGGGWVSVQFHPEMTAAAFVRSWSQSEPERCTRYAESPRGALLLRNFLEHAGLDAAGAAAPAEIRVERTPKVT